MYYRNDYNSPHEPWEQPIETTGHVVEEPGHKEPKKKKSFGGKIVALCLVCALVGGVAGGAGVAAFSGNNSGGSTTLVEGERTPTVVNVSNVTTKDPLTASQIYQAYVGSTVGITTEIVTTNYFGQPVSQAAAGSGFVISDNGYILTNYHVIKGASSIKVAFMDGTNYDATLVGGESETTSPCSRSTPPASPPWCWATPTTSRWASRWWPSATPWAS